jgi:hypothetical protein
MNSTLNGTWQVIDGKLVEPDPKIFDQGYWVAITNEVAVGDDQVDELTIFHVDNGVEFVGIWYDNSRDVTYVDEVKLVGDLIDAIKLGRQHSQECILDIRNNCKIDIRS